MVGRDVVDAFDEDRRADVLEHGSSPRCPRGLRAPALGVPPGRRRAEVPASMRPLASCLAANRRSAETTSGSSSRSANRLAQEEVARLAADRQSVQGAGDGVSCPSRRRHASSAAPARAASTLALARSDAAPARGLGERLDDAPAAGRSSRPPRSTRRRRSTRRVEAGRRARPPRRARGRRDGTPSCSAARRRSPSRASAASEWARNR